MNKKKYLTPWEKYGYGMDHPFQGWKRYYVFDRCDYAARITSVYDYYCTGPLGALGGKHQTIDELMAIFDRHLIKEGYMLLTENQMKTIELLT